MSWPLRLIEPSAAGDDGWQPGDCWYVTGAGYVPSALELSDEYHRDHEGQRPPIIVALPTTSDSGEIHAFPFCVDERTSDAAKEGSHGGWTVTGDLPNITVTPSIKVGGAYHGFITAGVLTDSQP